MNSAYIYGLVDPRSNEIRYIGKTIDPEKRLRDHIKESKMLRRNSHNYNWIRRLLIENLVPFLKILEEVPEDNWKEAERDWISSARFIGLNLTNKTDGGDGVSSYTNQGKKFSEKHRENLSKAGKGRKFSKEHRRNLSRSGKGKRLKNQSALGYRHTEETKQRISRTLKIGSHVAYWKGKKFSKEHKRKLSEAGKKYWTEKRLRENV